MSNLFKRSLAGVLAFLAFTSLAACDNSQNNINTTSEPTALVALEPLSTASADDEEATTDGTFAEATESAVDTESSETEEATKAPTAEPTEIPTEAPTATPTAVPTAVPTEDPQPTADPAIYTDDLIYGVGTNWWTYSSIFQTDGDTAIIWTESRHIVMIPDSFPDDNWIVQVVDAENEQLLIRTGHYAEGTLQYYALVDGTFYKLSQGKIISKCSTAGETKWTWVEADGTVYSVGVRSKYYNEVYVEGYGYTESWFSSGKLVCGTSEGIGYGIKEDILREITPLS